MPFQKAKKGEGGGTKCSFGLFLHKKCASYVNCGVGGEAIQAMPERNIFLREVVPHLVQARFMTLLMRHKCVQTILDNYHI